MTQTKTLKILARVIPYQASSSSHESGSSQFKLFQLLVFLLFLFSDFFFNHTPEAEVLIQRQDEIQTDEISCFNCSKR